MHIATSGSKIEISKESLTAKIAKKFSKVLKHGDIVFLYGDIGAGKTTFVRYLINSNLFFKYNFKSEKRFLEFRNKKKGHIFNVKNKP